MDHVETDRLTACPSCGAPMRFLRTVPAAGDLREMQTFECRVSPSAGGRISRLSARFLQSGRVEKCKTGTTPECVTVGASQTDEVNARLKRTRVPIGLPG
jgi:hypothetical protein